ncbi:hypothetical protein [Actinokineospora terrae]|uniref:Uncharacterized protein n=1 Tax=Actinokineospora terrae TaxID=155974 RepID=A0A1H9T685_9PSEU|nr:hypothetical protein [Actinokineospora terrae]SER92607.1 hypothetical protein SAMN04487818_10687 [Actinokineospora terrae]
MPRTKSGLLLPILAVAGIVAYLGPEAVIDTVTGVFENQDPVLIEDEGHQLLWAVTGKPRPGSAPWRSR